MSNCLILSLLIKKYILLSKNKSLQNLEELMKVNIKLNHFYIEATKSYITNILKFIISLVLIFIVVLILNNLKAYLFNKL